MTSGQEYFRPLSGGAFQRIAARNQSVAAGRHASAVATATIWLGLTQGRSTPESVSAAALLEILGNQSQSNLNEAYRQLSASQQAALHGVVGPSLEEWISLSQESHPLVYAQGLLGLGRRALADHHLTHAAAIFQALSESNGALGLRVPESISHQAEREFLTIQGNGPWGARVEFLGRRFAGEVLNPSMILGMGAAGIVASSCRLGMLSRLLASPQAHFLSRGGGARMLASTTAFVPEVGAFWATTRVVNEVLHPGIQPWDLASMGREWASLGITLGALKLSGWAARGLFDRVHGIHPGASGFARTPRIVRFSRPLVEQAGMFAGISLGHLAESRLGLRPVGSTDALLIDSLAMLFQFNAAGQLSRGLMGPRHAAAMQGMEFRSRTLDSNLGARPSLLSGLQLLPEGATPGMLSPAARPESKADRSHILQMTGGEGNGFGEGTPPEHVIDRPLALRGYSGQMRWHRVILERLIQEHHPEFFSPEHLATLLSETHRDWAPEETGNVLRAVEAYLSEGNISRFQLKDSSVQESARTPWMNTKTALRIETPAFRQTLKEIEAAYLELHQYVFEDGSGYEASPLRRMEGLSRALGREIWAVSETGRETGSFKERGAIVEVLRAARDGILHVVTGSHGNHGLAVGLAAKKIGLRATVVVPETTPQVKIDRLRALDATVVVVRKEPWRGYEAARDWGLRYVIERNIFLERSLEIDAPVTRYIHGFEDVIPGQGVLGLDIAEQVAEMPPELRSRLERATFLVPMGGGGLASGLSVALHARLPDSWVIGVGSEQAPALHHSLVTGRRSEVLLNEKGLCDSGIGLTIPGARPFEILKDTLNGSMTVSDPLVGEAMRLIHRHEGEVVEGSAAAGIAALLDGRLKELEINSEVPIVTIFSGGNIDSARHRLVMEGKEAYHPGGVLEAEAPLLKSLAPLIGAVRGEAPYLRIRELFREQRLDLEEVRKVVQFGEEGFARTHLVKEGGMQIDLLAWKDGQMAPAHDHGRSWGLNQVLEGEMIEQRFELGPDGQLKPTSLHRIRPGEVTEMPDDIIHEVYNRQGDGKTLVALQLFVPIMDGMKFYPRP